MGEAWRAIPGYEGVYEVSDLGAVRSYYRRGYPAGSRKAEPSALALDWGPDGYAVVSLRGADGRSKRVGVHRLVLMAFDRLPLPGEQACHFDGDTSNNARSNLRWGQRRGQRRRPDSTRHAPRTPPGAREVRS